MWQRKRSQQLQKIPPEFSSEPSNTHYSRHRSWKFWEVFSSSSQFSIFSTIGPTLTEQLQVWKWTECCNLTDSTAVELNCNIVDFLTAQLTIFFLSLQFIFRRNHWKQPEQLCQLWAAIIGSVNVVIIIIRHELILRMFRDLIYIVLHTPHRSIWAARHSIKKSYSSKLPCVCWLFIII